MLKNIYKKYFKTLVFILCFIVFGSLSYISADNSIVFIYDSVIDEQFVSDESGYAPSLWKSALDNYDYLRVLKKYAKEEPLTITVYPIVFDFLVSIDSNPYVAVFRKNIEDMTKADKDFIYNKCRTLPTQFLFEDFPYYKELVDRVNYGLHIDTAFLSSFGYQELLDLIVWFHIVWSSDKIFEFNLVQNLIEKENNFTEKDLKKLLFIRDEELKKAYTFYKDMPLYWELIVYPYYSTHFSLTNHNLYDPNDKKSKKFDYIQDISWSFVKSVKSFDKFFEYFPEGLVSSIDVFDSRIFQTLWIDGINVLFNKSEKFNLKESFILKQEDKAIYVLSNNSFIEDYQGEYDIDTTRYLVENFINNLPDDPIFIYKNSKFESFENNKEFLRILIKRISVYLDFGNITNLKGEEGAREGEEIKYRFDTKNVTSKKMFIGNSSVNKDYFSVKTSTHAYENISNYYLWNEVKKVREYVEKYQNSGNARIKVLDEIYYKMQRLESSLWYRIKYLRADIKETFYWEIMRLLSLIRDTINMENKYIEKKKSKSVLVKIDENTTKQVKEFTEIRKFKNTLGFTVRESFYDDYGDGNYLYPTNTQFLRGTFDIRQYSVIADDNDIVFTVRMRQLSNPDYLDLGFSLLQLDIYIDMNNREGLGYNKLLVGRNAYTRLNNAWEFCVSVNGEAATLYQVDVDDKIMDVMALETKVDLKKKTIKIIVPRDVLIGDPLLWNYLVVSCGYDSQNQDKIRYVREQPDFDHFGGKYNNNSPNIIDMILPKRLNQNGVFKSNRAGAVELPFINLGDDDEQGKSSNNRREED